MDSGFILGASVFRSSCSACGSRRQRKDDPIVRAGHPNRECDAGSTKVHAGLSNITAVGVDDVYQRSEERRKASASMGAKKELQKGLMLP